MDEIIYRAGISRALARANTGSATSRYIYIYLSIYLSIKCAVKKRYFRLIVYSRLLLSSRSITAAINRHLRDAGLISIAGN